MLYIQKILLINFINISTKFKIIQKITNILASVSIDVILTCTMNIYGSPAFFRIAVRSM